MTRKELMTELKNMNVAYKATMKTTELEKLYNENTKKESETKKMTGSTRKYKEFDILVDILNRNNIMIVNETDRRVTTANVMFCRRKNKVRAYIKLKAYREFANEFNAVAERNTQYVAYIDIILNDYAESMIKKICQ